MVEIGFYAGLLSIQTLDVDKIDQNNVLDQKSSRMTRYFGFNNIVNIDFNFV